MPSLVKNIGMNKRIIKTTNTYHIVHNPDGIDKNIIQYGPTRSGTTVIHQILSSIFRSTAKTHEIVASHDYDKIVATIRNPRDLIVSLWCTHSNEKTPYMSMDDIKKYWRMVLYRLNTARFYRTPDTLWLRYETFVNNFDYVFQALEAHLDIVIPYDLREKLKTEHSLEANRTIADSLSSFQQSDEISGIHGDHINTGGINIWEQAIRPEHQNKFKAITQSIVDEWGYGKQLSILICSLDQRFDLLSRLKNILKSQITNQVEVLCNKDGGWKSIGQKRQELLEKARGRYIAFVDDDDRVSPDYVEKVLDAIKQDPDVIGIHLIMGTDAKLSGLTYHSLKYDTWFSTPGDEPSWKYYYRNPNHLNPVKRELALRTGFKSINMGEDRKYSLELLPHLKTEVYIETPIYYYDHITNKLR